MNLTASIAARWSSSSTCSALEMGEELSGIGDGSLLGIAAALAAMLATPAAGEAVAKSVK